MKLCNKIVDEILAKSSCGCLRNNLVIYNIFLEKRILRKMYMLLAGNDCFEILSVVLTLHAAFLSSSLQLVGYGRDIPQTDF